MSAIAAAWTGLCTRVGRGVLGGFADVGGMALRLRGVVRAGLHRRPPRREFIAAMHHFGIGSLPLTAITALFMGLTLVLQSAFYVKQFGAQDLIGWFAGYSVMRQLGPVVLGLMLSGRVGANNAAELATLRATERLDALRILGVDLDGWLLLPRVAAMVLSQVILLMVANVVALSAGAAGARLLLHIPFGAFFGSITARLGAADLLLGVGKSVVFGLTVALVSTHFGCAHRGGATEVGHAVRQQVVACALCLFGLDYGLTLWIATL